MPNGHAERGPTFEREILPRREARAELAKLRNVIDEIGVDSPREGVRDRVAGELLSGAESAAALVSRYGQVIGESADAVADGRWLRRGRPPAGAARDAFDVLITIALASQAAPMPDNFGSLVTRLMFGTDPTTVLFRDVLLGKRVPEDEGNPWGDPGPGRGRIPFEQLNDLACIRNLQDSLTQIGVATAGLPRPRPRAGAVITSIEPNPAVPGGVAIIRGTGLGAAAPDAVLVFGKTVARTTRWTDTEIHAIVPLIQGEYCVSIVEQAVAAGDNMALLLEATANVAGALGECFGAAGAAAGSRFEKIPFGVWLAEATCQADRRNAVWVGAPRIEFFAANDDISGAYIWRPHKPLTLRWKVAAADSVAMTTDTQSGAPPARMAAFVPSDSLPAGSLSFAALDSVIPWSTRYTLNATNASGTSRAALDVSFRARIGIIATSGGVRCAFQAGAITAMGGLLDTEPEVYGASGFGALTTRAAAANFRNVQALHDFWNTFSHPVDMLVGDPVVNQLNTVDNQSYRHFLVSARRASTEFALGFGTRGGTFLSVPDIQFGQIWMSNFLSLSKDMTADAAASVSTLVTNSLLGASTSAASSFPWAALVIFAIKVGVDIGISVDSRNKIVAALARRSVRDPAQLMTAIDALVAAVGPVKTGTKLRIALGNLEAGDVNYANEQGAIVAQPLGSLTATGPLTQALKASVSTPPWLPPVKIGNANFVDGAVVDPAPLDAVVDAGADHVYILQPNARFLIRVDSFDSLGFALVERRAQQMRERAFLGASMAPHERWLRRENGVLVVGDTRIGVELIEATLDLTGFEAFLADNGMIGLWSDYGYLRAFDVLAPRVIFPDESQRDARAALATALAANSDQITAARYFAYHVEHSVHAQSVIWAELSPDSEIVLVSTSDGVEDLRATKRAIRGLIETRLTMVKNAPRTLGGRFPEIPAVPSSYANWFLGWEKHYWGTPLRDTPWHDLGGFGDGTHVDAATPPAPIDPNLFTA
jgi:predicted acylesterase/phospholipase RssA